MALEFSISGMINRACVCHGVLREPRAGHWEQWKPRGKTRKQLFLQKGPTCLWEAGKAQTAELGSLNFPARSMSSNTPRTCASAEALLGTW